MQVPVLGRGLLLEGTGPWAAEVSQVANPAVAAYPFDGRLDGGRCRNFGRDPNQTIVIGFTGSLPVGVKEQAQPKHDWTRVDLPSPRIVREHPSPCMYRELPGIHHSRGEGCLASWSSRPPFCEAKRCPH
jgi:hypothetical protein